MTSRRLLAAAAATLCFAGAAPAAHAQNDPSTLGYDGVLAMASELAKVAEKVETQGIIKTSVKQRAVVKKYAKKVTPGTCRTALNGLAGSYTKFIATAKKYEKGQAGNKDMRKAINANGKAAERAGKVCSV